MKKDPFDTDTEDEDEEEILRQINPYKPKIPTTPFISFIPGNAKVHMSKFELSGLRAIVSWLTKISPSKRMVPELVISAENLIKDARQMIEDHLGDSHELSITNRPILFWLTKKSLIALNNAHSESSKANHRSTNNHYQTKPTSTTPFGGIVKRPKSELESSNSEYRVSSGTTLKNDLIPSSFEALISQTGRGSGMLFNRSLVVTNASHSMASSSSSFTTASRINGTLGGTATTNTTGSAFMAKTSQPTIIPSYQQPPTGYSNHHYSNQGLVNYYPGNLTTSTTSQVQPVNRAAISAEHAYNQSPALYQNPHMHHNYAYHPYRQIRPHIGNVVVNRSPDPVAVSQSSPHLSVSSQQQQLPIRPVPVVQTAVQAPTVAVSSQPTIYKPTAQVATVQQMNVIVRPVTYLAQTPSITYQTAAYQPAANYQTGYSAHSVPQQQQPQQAQLNGQYYQYYQGQPQAPQVQVIQQQSSSHLIKQSQSISSPSQSQHSPLPSQPTAQPQLIYYHNQQPLQPSTPTSGTHQPIVIRPQFVQQPVYQPQPLTQSQSVVYSSQYSRPYSNYTTAQQSNISTAVSGLYTTPAPQPIASIQQTAMVSGPKNIYYVSNSMATSVAPVVQPPTQPYTYNANQAYLMTQQAYNPQSVATQPLIVSHQVTPSPTQPQIHAMSSQYHPLSPQPTTLQPSQVTQIHQQQVQSHQQQQQQQHQVTATVPIAGISPYQHHGYPAVSYAQPPQYNIQYGR